MNLLPARPPRMLGSWTNVRSPERGVSDAGAAIIAAGGHATGRHDQGRNGQPRERDDEEQEKQCASQLERCA